jgi:23S rRNA pseudouridine1911/1915/1917 synthase
VVREFTEPEASLVACQLETGRTHQIRVHLAAAGHPVVGDSAYGGHRVSMPMNRPFLHAGSLSFAHPVTGDVLSFTVELPDDLQQILARCH